MDDKVLPQYLKKWSFCPLCSSNLKHVEEESYNSYLECSNTTCSFTHYPNPMPTASVVLFNSSYDKVLLGIRKNNPGKGEYSIPGGFIYWSETALAAAMRELKEETNLIANNFELLGLWPGKYSPKQELYTLNVHFMANITVEAQDMVAGDDLLDLEWASIHQVPKLAFLNQELAMAEALSIVKDMKTK